MKNVASFELIKSIILLWSDYINPRQFLPPSNSPCSGSPLCPAHGWVTGAVCLAGAGQWRWYCLATWWDLSPHSRLTGGRGAGADHSSANTFPTNLVMMKGAQVIGCPVAIHTRADPTIRPPRVAAIDLMVKEGLLRPYVSHVFPLSKIKEAMHAKWGRQITGCCVVDCTLPQE